MVLNFRFWALNFSGSWFRKYYNTRNRSRPGETPGGGIEKLMVACGWSRDCDCNRYSFGDFTRNLALAPARGVENSPSSGLKFNRIVLSGDLSRWYEVIRKKSTMISPSPSGSSN